jgi:hypothetical protein
MSEHLDVKNRAPAPKNSRARNFAPERTAAPPASNHIPPGTKCVTVKQWRAYFYERSPLEKPDKPDILGKTGHFAQVLQAGRRVPMRR